MRRVLLLSCLTLLSISSALPISHSGIHGLRARFDPSQNSIFAEWQLVPHKDVPFMVRYRTMDNSAHWHYVRTRHPLWKLDAEELRNNANVELQVRADDRTNEDWSHPLIIQVGKRIVVDGRPVSQDQLLPPLDFTADILSQSSVKLQWKATEANPEIIYIVNVKQITSRTKGPYNRQQIKTSTTSFTLEGLEPGERYEMTIRSSLPNQQASSTASVVEIQMPYDQELFDIGNLIISSHFKADGHGTVTLTWDVPHHMQHRIKEYDVKYAEAGTDDWTQVQFTNNGQGKATLSNLRSDSNYVLKIRTTLINGLTTESSTFKFKTPHVAPNPISKVDVIYSHDVNSVQLQWVLQGYIQSKNVVGYEVFLSENMDAPESAWRYMRVDGAEGTLTLDHLKSLATYYVRIHVKTAEGEMIRPTAVYKFQTIDWPRNLHHYGARVNPFE